MHVIKSDKLVCFDVDDTLVAPGYDLTPEDVLQTDVIEKVTINCSGVETTVFMIKENIEAIKRHKGQGQIVIVWSNAGYKWAEAVVKSLKLTKYTDFIMSKPAWYYDDLPCEKWMGAPRWGKERR